MSIDQARALYARHSGGDAERWDAFGLAGITEHFYRASPSERTQVWEAFIAFALEGDVFETSLAERFLANNAAPAAMYGPLVAAVSAGGHRNQSAIESILGASSTNLDDADRATLTRVFIANPVAHFGLAGNLVRRDPRGPAWDAFARALAQVTDVSGLIAGYEAATLARREPDYAGILATRPPEQLRELAPLLPSGAGDQLLQAAGLA